MLRKWSNKPKKRKKRDLFHRLHLNQLLHLLPSQSQMRMTELLYTSYSHHSSNHFKSNWCASPLKNVYFFLRKTELSVILIPFLFFNCFRKDPDQFFAWPVSDVIAPGYSAIIQNPMDFSTMKENLDKQIYSSIEDFKVLSYYKFQLWKAHYSLKSAFLLLIFRLMLNWCVITAWYIIILTPCITKQLRNCFIQPWKLWAR